MSVFLASLALQEEVESLTRVQWESRKQSEKDRATLLSQMRVLESELEDQLVQHRGCAQLAEEVATLKQQLAALDKHLRSQRQFMDVRRFFCFFCFLLIYITKLN
jgi:pericentrin